MKLLLAYDCFRRSDHALEEAAKLAADRRAEVTVLSVVPESEARASKSGGHRFLAPHAETDLAAAHSYLRERGIECHTKMAYGNPVDEILNEATGGEYDLLVVGSRARGDFRQLLFGSVSRQLTKAAPCPVLIAGEHVSVQHDPTKGPLPDGALKKIVLATDGSDAADAAVEFGLEFAGEHGAHITFVHVIPVDEYTYPGRLGGSRPVQHSEPLDESETVLESATEAARAAGVPFALERISAPPVDGILSIADKCAAELIVVGSRGRGTLGATLLGSVSSDLVHRSNRPVLIVKATRVPVES